MLAARNAFREMVTQLSARDPERFSRHTTAAAKPSPVTCWQSRQWHFSIMIGSAVHS